MVAMSLDKRFRSASEAAWFWLNTVHLVAEFGRLGRVDQAYERLLPTSKQDRGGNLQNSYHNHAEVLQPALEACAAVSDGAIRWEHGRGLSAIARVPDDVYPHRWSSAHEAAFSLAGMALDLLAWPLEGVSCPDKQRRLAEQLLTSRWKAIAITQDEVADYQERIRRERAKLLANALPEEESKVTVLPGGFQLRGGERQQLVGKPLDVLGELVNARGNCRTRAELSRAVWPDVDLISYPDQAVLDATCALRKALIVALEHLGVSDPKNPLPSTGSGENLAYRLDLSDLPE
jgi:hypothetical protein